MKKSTIILCSMIGGFIGTLFANVVSNGQGGVIIQSAKKVGSSIRTGAADIIKGARRKNA